MGEFKVSECAHQNAEFCGAYSFIGYYDCPDCGAAISPVDYHKLMGYMHIDLIDYYKENPDKLNPIWDINDYV